MEMLMERSPAIDWKTRLFDKREVEEEEEAKEDEEEEGEEQEEEQEQEEEEEEAEEEEEVAGRLNQMYELKKLKPSKK